METTYTVPFRCGLDGEEWTAELGPLGPKLGFVRFVRKGEEVQQQPIDRKAELRRRLDALLMSKAPLPPPEQSEVVETRVTRQLTGDDVTDYNFTCPSCGNGQLLLCPECGKFMCRGGRDPHGRYICHWCGETLVSRPLTTEERAQPRPPTKIDGQTSTLQIRTRELPPGERDASR